MPRSFYMGDFDHNRYTGQSKHMGSSQRALYLKFGSIHGAEYVEHLLSLSRLVDANVHASSHPREE